ncbi:MAG: hypothetical protein KDI98_04670 [Hyphomicrobiaceae bacterium]|nr:hypothetical protein [Hyphomicrobiaceae bacterium]
MSPILPPSQRSAGIDGPKAAETPFIVGDTHSVIGARDGIFGPTPVRPFEEQPDPARPGIEDETPGSSTSETRPSEEGRERSTVLPDAHAPEPETALDDPGPQGVIDREATEALLHEAVGAGVTFTANDADADDDIEALAGLSPEAAARSAEQAQMLLDILPAANDDLYTLLAA